jgi:hypothetical protein
MNVGNPSAKRRPVQSQPSGFFQFEGVAGFDDCTGWWKRNAGSANGSCEVGGGELWKLGALDGGMGNESIEAENMPLLAMLAPPKDS